MVVISLGDKFDSVSLIFFNFFTAIVIGVWRLFRYFFLLGSQKKLFPAEYLEYFVFAGLFLTCSFSLDVLYIELLVSVYYV